MTYTLKHYYEEAAISPIPEWAGEIELKEPTMGGPLKPRWHQVTALNLAFAYPNGRSGIFDEMGTGKTVPSQAYAIWNAWQGNKVVVLLPPILRKQYLHSLVNTFKGIDKHLKVEIYHADKAKRDKICGRWYEEGSPDIVITTYDLFRKEFVMFDSMFGYKVLVMDEARVLGNEENKTYTAVERFMGPVGEKGALVMTGSAANNDLTDLFGYINFITPGVYRNRVQFDSKHVVYQSVDVKTGKFDKQGREIMRRIDLVDHFKDHNELYNNLYLQARRIEKHEVLEIPDKNIVPIRFDLGEQHKKVYEKLVNERLLIFEDNSIIDVTASSAIRHTCMQAVVHPEDLRVNEKSAVFEALDELLEEIDVTRNKVFLLCHYRKTAEKLVEYLARFKPALIYGGNSGRSEHEKDRFLNDPECRVLVANYVSGGVGLNLQGVCCNAICVEPTTVPGDFDQACDRLHRSGQKNKVNIYLLIATGTIFVKTVGAMQEKKDEIRRVVSAGKTDTKQSLKAELLGKQEVEDEVVEAEMEDW